MMVRNAAGAAALAILLAGCASGATPPPSSTPLRSLAAERGQRIAEIRCAGCHAINLPDESPRSGAPAFAQIRLRYNALSWERVMREIAEGRHGEMPPVSLADSELAELRAYIETLR